MRLNIFPDGGVARLRIYGKIELDWFVRDLDEETESPRVDVTFQVSAADEHYHIPLLLSPYGYSTYRGS